MCINSLDRDLETLFVAPIRLRCELNNRVQRNFNIRQILLREIVEIRVEATEHSLRDDGEISSKGHKNQTRTLTW
jgi:hypothetical protein